MMMVQSVHCRLARDSFEKSFRYGAVALFSSYSLHVNVSPIDVNRYFAPFPRVLSKEIGFRRVKREKNHSVNENINHVAFAARCAFVSILARYWFRVPLYVVFTSISILDPRVHCRSLFHNWARNDTCRKCAVSLNLTQDRTDRSSSFSNRFTVSRLFTLTGSLWYLIRIQITTNLWRLGTKIISPLAHVCGNPHIFVRLSFKY